MAASRKKKAAANRLYQYGQKEAIAVAAVTEAGAAGILSDDLRELLQSTQFGVAAMMTRLRKEGHEIVGRRDRHNASRFYLAKFAPPGGRSEIMPADREEAARLLPIIAASGPEGLDYYKIPHETPRKYRGGLAALRAQGLAYVTKYSTAHGMHVFAHAEWLDAYIAGLRKAKQPRPKPAPKPAKVAKVKPAKQAKPKPQPMPRAAQPWTPPQPKELPAPIIPAGVKPTVIPAPKFDKRYQVDPSTRVLGGFATMGIGRYLEDTRSAA
jgi:hypothetical protein